jgi:nitrogen fixation protein FixH
MIPALASSGSTAAARGRWIPWIFVGGMLTVFLVNAVLVFFAMSSWSGIATDRPFERGLAYNRLLAAAAAEEALGWKAEIAYRDGGLTVLLRDADDRPIEGAALSFEARRPLERHASIGAVFASAGMGRYEARVDDLRPGQWDIRLAVVRGDAAAHLGRRIVVR